uniref:Uncharacterized protein n=1 Tax=Plectus sambesii TaxID=2011161 RepID=A0A914WFI7_9BILA
MGCIVQRAFFHPLTTDAVSQAGVAIADNDDDRVCAHGRLPNAKSLACAYSDRLAWNSSLVWREVVAIPSMRGDDDGGMGCGRPPRNRPRAAGGCVAGVIAWRSEEDRMTTTTTRGMRFVLASGRWPVLAPE